MAAKLVVDLRARKGPVPSYSEPPPEGLKDDGITIVVVDDDEGDAEGIRRGFTRHNLTNKILVNCDAREALALLRDVDPATCVHRPFLILLDRNMPRMTGPEFLAELRRDVRLRDSLVFMLTPLIATSRRRMRRTSPATSSSPSSEWDCTLL